MDEVKFEKIISVENLLLAWTEFLRGKKSKRDVQEFQLHLMDNVLSLHQDLKNKTYSHGGYHAFNISDPKPRNIHKAQVRDRLLHHAIYRVLYPFYEKKFTADSYSCRLRKGTHKAINRFREFSRKVSKNNTKTCFVLKCDIKKFFANIDHQTLKSILSKCLPALPAGRFDTDVMWLLERVIDSFNSNQGGGNPSALKGLPLGNLTSQLLVNIYMNEFDQYVKRVLKVKYYIRYADDFVILHNDRTYLENLIPTISSFLSESLKLSLHPDKVYIKTLASGVDFLGWAHFPHHRILRTVTKRRMLKNLSKNPKKESIQSYLGMLKHGDTYGLERKVKNLL